jgi:hypothetical protein
VEYSESTDAAFCFNCLFFSFNGTAVKGHTDPAFTKNGFKNWHRAGECFERHEKSRCHISSVSSWLRYSKDKPIDVQLEDNKEVYLSQQEKLKKRNRDIMERLINIIICIKKGGCPLRGHDETSGSAVKGLYLEIVNLIAKYDPLLKEHTDSGPRNATYLSKDIQNDIITSIRNDLLKNIKFSLKGKLVSVTSDETSDCGHHEQMAFVLCYFDEKLNRPEERFISFKRLLGVDAPINF